MEEIIWMSTRQVAEFILRSERTLKKWRHDKTGPKWHKAGHNVRYVKSEVVYWMLHDGKNEGE